MPGSLWDRSFTPYRYSSFNSLWYCGKQRIGDPSNIASHHWYCRDDDTCIPFHAPRWAKSRIYFWVVHWGGKRAPQCLRSVYLRLLVVCVKHFFVWFFFSGFAQLYRFAAADVASEDFKSKAISLVLAGGVVAGFLGPESAKLGQNLVTSTPFVGAYLILTATTFASIFVLLFLDIPPLTSAERAGPRRPIGTIMMQPVFLAAALAAMISQGVMNFLMTASPIAMATCGLPFSDTAFVIEWHIFGMFAPGFFTGHLVKKFGEVKIIICGLFLQFVCVLVALEGIEVAHFWLSMFLLGVGWNFAFTAATSLMTTAYRTSERAKTQGAMNFLIYGFVSIMSLSSGALVHYFGWSAVNFGALPFLVIAVIATLWYAISQNQGEVRST